MTTSAEARLQLIFAAKNLASGEMNKLHAGMARLKGGATGLAGGLRSAAGGVANLAKFAGLAAIGGLAALATAVVAGAKALADQSKIDAQTAAVIKSTGAAAHVTAKHVDELANSIKDYSGVDDDAIKKGENMLLTFTNIRNGVGKNNQIFDRSTKILADMSVAMGTDMSSQAIQLGKALNDPVKGITALTKVGVTFTDGQRKQIAAMVKHGDVAGAQTVILKELEREFGGSAKAAGDSAAGGWNKLQNAISDLTKQLASYLMPIFTAVVTFVTTKVIPAVSDIADKVAAWVTSNQPLIAQIQGVLHQAIDLFVTGLRSIIHVFTDFGPLPRIIGAVTAAVLLLSMAVRANPIVAIAGAIVVAVGALATAWETDFGGIRETARGMFVAFKKGYDTYLRPVVDAIATVVTTIVIPALAALIGAARGVASFLWGGGKGPLPVALTLAGGGLRTIAGAVGVLINALRSVVIWLQTAIAWLGTFSKTRTAAMDAAHLRGEPWPPRARGGPVWPGGVFSVGETGSRESLLFSTGGGVVLPDGGAAARHAGGGGSQVIHTHVYLNGREIAEAVDRHEYWAGAGVAASGNRT